MKQINNLEFGSTFSNRSSNSRNSNSKFNTTFLKKGLTLLPQKEFQQKSKLFQLDYQLPEVCTTTRKREIIKRLRIPTVPSIDKLELQESQRFTMIGYQKKSYRVILNEQTYAESVISLPPSDPRINIIYEIIKNLFNEIELRQNQILICQHILSKMYFVYFSEIEQIPVSKCCYKQIEIQISQVIGGQICCTHKNCPIRILSTFEVNEQALWRQRYGTPYREITTKFSNYVQTGKYRTKSLANSLSQESKSKSKEKQLQALVRSRVQQEHEKKDLRIRQIRNPDSFKYDMIRNIMLYYPVFNREMKEFDELLK